MKTPSVPLNTVLLGLLVILALTGGWQPQAVSAQPPANQPVAPVQQTSACDTWRTVTVSGAAVINVTPDRALIQLGVQTNGQTPDGTQTANFLAMQRVMNSIKSLGVDAKDIATDYYIVYPVYDDYNSLYIKGYRLSNTLSITLRDISLVDDVIIEALKAGANEVQQVQFYSSELRKYRDQARQLAVIAATEKAQALADAAGTSTGCVISIDENTWAQFYGGWYGGRQMALWAQNVYQNADPGSGITELEDSPLSLGKITVRAEVSVRFSLE